MIGPRAVAWVALALVGARVAASPTHLSVEGPVDALGRAEDCGACHAEQVAQWRRSAHAHASLDNPWYRASFDALRAERGPRASAHCAGCHDPVLLASGVLGEALGPDTPLADQGVSCLVCHGAVSVGPRGNADLHVDLTDLPDPWMSRRAHRARMRGAPIEDGTVCQACHRGFLVPETGNPTVIPGFDDWGAWRASGWSDISAARVDPPSERRDCVDCHMQGGHGMPGGRTAIAAQTGQLAEVRAMLQRAVTLGIPVARVAGERVDPADLAPVAGTEVELDVVVRNVGAGHRFPGGLADIQDVWLELSLGGERFETGPLLGSLPLDDAGVPVRNHTVQRVVTKAFDHTVPPGEAQVFRVRVVAPGGPLEIAARLLHRPHREALAREACGLDGGLDGCVPAPITVLAHAGIGADPASLYAHALGWSRGLQEDLDEALRSLGDRDDPAAWVLWARVLGRQGRYAEAREAAERAGVDHPAVHAAIGRAAMEVWSWAEAAHALERAVAGAPLDAALWRDLARSHGSLGDPSRALRAAEQGLALDPRDPDLLHTRANALRDLGDPRAEPAMEAWLAHRPVDEAGELRRACDRLDPECALREPIPVVELRKATGP